MGEWVKTGQISGVADLATSEVYSKIRNMGLKTVNWERFSPRTLSELYQMYESCQEFIQENSPCLFIWEPRWTGEKGYFIDVESMDFVDMALLNLPVFDFSYLTTTQISNPGLGFIGTAISDGRGRLYCETYHESGVCSHRAMSQSKIDESKSNLFGRFVSKDFEILSLEGNTLSAAHIRMLHKTYEMERGYFEFVYGNQLGEWGLYTTGFENLGGVSFPEQAITGLLMGREGRWRGETLRHHLDLLRD